ncbi:MULTISPECIES: HNH endonuclease [Hyphomicrobiales]|jgi:5-methylcytosine-specific restriction endonuclease McrA|uniref:HNH endonuclease n=1 Tax=Methylobacterium sp. CCH7-A2 TaxID=1768789 RepID=UPI0009EBD1A7|nr:MULTISPECIES: HNH endonuclease [Hyphomicrobiales]
MKRLCQCGTLVPKGERCSCQRARAKAKDAERGSAAERGYDADWRALRAQFIAANPQCVECGAPAKHVDHIRTIREAPHLRLDPRNLRSLCHSCHSRHTARTQPFGRPTAAR